LSYDFLIVLLIPLSILATARAILLKVVAMLEQTMKETFGTEGPEEKPDTVGTFSHNLTFLLNKLALDFAAGSLLAQPTLQNFVSVCFVTYTMCPDTVESRPIGETRRAPHNFGRTFNRLLGKANATRRT
jgi:hypothetical protein